MSATRGKVKPEDLPMCQHLDLSQVANSISLLKHTRWGVEERAKAPKLQKFRSMFFLATSLNQLLTPTESEFSHLGGRGVAATMAHRFLTQRKLNCQVIYISILPEAVQYLRIETPNCLHLFITKTNGHRKHWTHLQTRLLYFFQHPLPQLCQGSNPGHHTCKVGILPLSSNSNLIFLLFSK